MTVLRDYVAAVSQPTFADAEAPLRYDEVAGPDGLLRPAWRALAAEADVLSDEHLRRVVGEIERFLSDDGVTYTPPGGVPGPWRLDPMPFVLTADEWAPLGVALAQRAELLNAILTDLYGERRLLSSGVLPPSVVFNHPGYLRPLARASSADTRPLVLLACDLGRTADGEWRVLADRTQAPSGMGYAMENRRVISRVLPGLYREAGLHRMAPFFQALRSALMEAAPEHVDNPRVVVLTPGTHSETAYDQAFLASSLGFPLVQGSDLTVREGSVWLRVLGRLERVDVILRRVDAEWSDPLELRGDSRLGVAGLAEASRRGSVKIVNGLGAGVLENPALMPYMARMCELLLDEPLRLPVMETAWLGDPEHLESALANLDRLVVRPIDRPGWRSVGSSDELRSEILAAPHRFVVRENLALSQSPVVGPAGVGPAPVVLRTFAIAYGSAYRPLVGGLASVLDIDGVRATKDVWVLKEKGEPDQGLTDVLPMTKVRAPEAMVPRVLEDMFWFGRYGERAEDMVRLVLVAHALADDFQSRPKSPGGAALAVLIGAMRDLSPASPGDDLDADFRAVLLDSARPGSVAQSIGAMRDAAEGVRDRLSGDIWRAFGSADRAAAMLRTNRHSHQIDESASRMLTGILAGYGVSANMVRDAGWHMLEVGRALERGQQLVRLLRGTTTVRRGLDIDREINQAILTASESSVTHRMRYRGNLRTTTVLELMLLDSANPRSLICTVDEVRDHLAKLPGASGASRPQRLLDDLRADLEQTDVQALAVLEGDGRPNLHQEFDRLLSQLTRLADAIAEVHLAGPPAPRSFGLGLTRPGGGWRG